MIRLFAVVLLAMLAASGFAPRASAFVSDSNLVTNPGFETGDFTGYTVQPATMGSAITVSNSNPHSGSDAADFGDADPGDFDSISQAITTVPTLTYNVSFYLAADSSGPGIGGPENSSTGVLPFAALPDQEFKVTFGSTVLFDTTDETTFGYTQLVFSAPADLGASTTLTFSGYSVNYYYHLDDISVTAVPEPSTWAIVAVGVGALGCMTMRRRRRS